MYILTPGYHSSWRCSGFWQATHFTAILTGGEDSMLSPEAVRLAGRGRADELLPEHLRRGVHRQHRLRHLVPRFNT